MKQNNLLGTLLQEIGSFYPFFRGQGKLVQSYLWQQATRNLDNVVVTKVKNGALIYVYPRDFVGSMIYYFGDLDPKVSWVCQRLLRLGDTMLDVGANYGLVSIIAAHLVGTTGAVHAFEPQPHLIELIQRSVKVNSYEQIIRVHGIALSEQNGIINLSIPNNNYGKASLSRKYNSGQTIEVPVKKLSDYLINSAIQSIRLMKIDVEGHEEEVFRGALDLFDKVTPEAIVFEFNQLWNAPFWQHSTAKLLDSIGYEFYDIPNVAFRVKLQKIEANSPRQIQGNDILALHKSANLKEMYAALSIS